MAPPPEGVVWISSDVDVNGYPASVGFWVLIPDADAGPPLYWLGLLGSVELQVWPGWLSCMHAGASFVTCRCLVGGIAPQWYALPAPPNHGEWTGGQAENVCMGLYVQSSSGGRGSGSRIHLPAVPDIFVQNNVQLSEVGRGNLLAAAVAMTDWAASVSGPTGAAVTIGTLQTRRAGAPLLPPVFDPALLIRPGQGIETMRRRLPRRGRISPV
jgi:hypothetical protein